MSSKPAISWNEVRARAATFATYWADKTQEQPGKHTFWNEFFEVFGLQRKSVAAFEEPVKNLRGKYSFIDLIWHGKLLVEHKSLGKSLDAATSQAFQYIQDLLNDGRQEDVPRYVVVTDFDRFALHDLEPESHHGLPLFDQQRVQTTEFKLSELPQKVREFSFIRGEKVVKTDPEDPANEKAYNIMVELHDAVKTGGFQGHQLERFLVRILFCVFAEDTGIFDPCAFESFIRTRTHEDGSDLGAQLNRLFDVLNTPENERQKSLDDDLAGFPYVNGRLFEEPLKFVDFDRTTRDALLGCCGFHWAKISPAVFGSLFQGVMDAGERRQSGGHYTSESNILKVIRPLFLDDLQREFEAIKTDRSSRRKSRLEEFQKKLRALNFLDPACGCGNFLIISYRELRTLELSVLKELYGKENRQAVLNVRELCVIDVDQFYGVEISEWPALIAEVALWLMDHQMNVAVADAFGQNFRRLPLRTSPHIANENALNYDWKGLLAPTECAFILGNPPFIGKHLMTAEQGKDMKRVWGETDKAGVLDYVTAWYRKAADYIQGTEIVVGYVSTSSISQGEQVGALWSPLFQQFKLKIHFAHKTFGWESEARGKAHVHVVIIGFGAFDTPNKRIYEEQNKKMTVANAKNISPYLIEGADVAMTSRTNPICNVPACEYGSKPTDGGHLIIEEAEREQFLAENPGAKKYLRPLLCAEEYLYSMPRWCLWLKDAAPADLRNMTGIRDRITAVREFRKASKKGPTQDMAERPALFAEIRQPKTKFMVVPQHTSETRKYVPFGYFGPEYIVHNSCSAIPKATLFHFGVLSSAIHMAWVRQICGRLESRYRYSTRLVYNNYPWPETATAKQRAIVEKRATAVLRARANSPKSTLAELYDPLSMPPLLQKAHADLDRAVERCYRQEKFRSEQECVGFLFRLYEEVTAPLAPRPETRKRPTTLG
jgi:hypothetical protein